MWNDRRNEHLISAVVKIAVLMEHLFLFAIINKEYFDIFSLYVLKNAPGTSKVEVCKFSLKNYQGPIKVLPVPGLTKYLLWTLVDPHTGNLWGIKTQPKPWFLLFPRVLETNNWLWDDYYKHNQTARIRAKPWMFRLPFKVYGAVITKN